MKNGSGIIELTRFQEHFREYKIIVYTGLNFNTVMFLGQAESDKRINLFFDEVTQNYQNTSNFTGAMVKCYICDAYNK